MKQVDTLGERPERHRAFSRELLAESGDPVLDDVVARAAKELKVPIALVTLVLDHVQFFKAHSGLSVELEAACGTERDVSFCQFVVREGKPFVVEDATTDPRVPQYLVQEYGIRSYLGVPLRVDDVVVGSLCIIDTVARKFTESDEAVLGRLAAEVEDRFRILTQGRRRARAALMQELSAPALGDLRENLIAIQKGTESCLQALVPVRSFLRHVAYAFNEKLGKDDLTRRNLEAARKAAEMSESVLFEIETAVLDTRDSVDALDAVLTDADGSVLSGILAAAQDLARPLTREVGGAPLPEISFDPVILAPRPLAVSLLSTCLLRFATALSRNGKRDGIRISVTRKGEHAQVSFASDGATVDDIEGLAGELAELTRSDPGVFVSCRVDQCVFEFVTARVES